MALHRTAILNAKHSDKDGNPSETLLKAKQERLENWRTLPKMTGLSETGHQDQRIYFLAERSEIASPLPMSRMSGRGGEDIVSPR